MRRLVSETKRGHIGDLQDPSIPYDQAIKKANHKSIESTIIEKQRHAEIVAGASSSSASPPPPPTPVDIPPSRDFHDTIS